jgi:hypothetical protein
VQPKSRVTLARMDNLLKFLIDNKEWIFSGVGAAILVGLGGMFLRRKTKGQNITAGSGSTNIQAGHRSQITITPIEKDRLAESKYDPAKIDRVLAIYDSIKSFIVEIQQNGTADNELLKRFLQETRHATVLFEEPEIVEYINMLYRKGVELDYVDKAISKTEGPDMDRILEKRENLFEWFCGQHDVAEDLFRPYLNK